MKWPQLVVLGDRREWLGQTALWRATDEVGTEQSPTRQSTVGTHGKIVPSEPVHVSFCFFLGEAFGPAAARFTILSVRRCILWLTANVVPHLVAKVAKLVVVWPKTGGGHHTSSAMVPIQCLH